MKSSRHAYRFAAVVLFGCLFAAICYASSPGQVRLQTNGNEYDALETSTPCRGVRFSQDQCAFVKRHCQDEDDGLISYLQLYYCSLPHLKGLAWIIILLWTALLFTSIGICAESFFSVNLSFIAKALHMSDTLAGVTLLALGNGGPDLFSTWASMAAGSPELAIGELVGAASFISTVIAGSIALLGPFYIRKMSFARDSFFLMLTALLLLPVLVTQKLYFWQGLVMIGLYVVYVGWVVGYHWWTRSTSSKSQNAQGDHEHHERSPLLPSNQHAEPSGHDRHEAPLHPHTAVYEEMNAWRRRHGMIIEARDDYFIQPSLVGSLEYRHRKRNSKKQNAELSGNAEGDGAEPVDRKMDFGARHIYEVLFPTLKDLGKRRTWHAFVNLSTTVPFFLMKITIPAAEFERKDDDGNESSKDRRWDRWLLIWQSFIAPQFVWALLWPYVTDSRDLDSWLHPALFCLAGSLILSLLLIGTTKSQRPPAWAPLIAVVGFGVSAYWLCTIANEVVAILKAIGAILGVSEGILGFTLFAIGNSIDDYVADMTVSQQGHQVMALSACFGGPLLNILLGLGTSVVYVTCRSGKAEDLVKPIVLHVDKTLLISTGVLAATMAAVLFALWLRQWQMGRSIGIGLICVWIGLATANVLVETLLEK